jgi:hypothetical protein
MGYYTYHTFSCDDPENEEKYKEELGEYTKYVDSLFQEGVKWYDCDEDMREFSKRYPEVLFIIYGEGEEMGDIWELYTKNGKQQRCDAEVTIPEYDLEKMV